MQDDLIARQIHLIRGRRMMLDSSLAGLYGVTTSNLNKAVKRNLERFPSDFMFQLSREEADALRFHFGISNPSRRGGRRYLPYAFTQEGVAMLSSVLRSKRAVLVNIAIMRAFVRLRESLTTQQDLVRKVTELERMYAEHDSRIQAIFEAIKKLLEPPPISVRLRIGFASDERQ